MEAIKFDGKVVIVTGAGAGIGRSHAMGFAQRGAKVVVNDLGGALDGSGGSHSAADVVVQEIKDLGGEAVANYDSVATIDGGKNIVQTAVDAFGTVDILVNNAGIVRDHSLTKLTEDEWDAVMDVHLKGAYCVTKPAFEVMKEKKYGKVIFTSSGVGLYGNFGQANYGAAKMGLIGLMNTLNIEGAKHNIKINAIAPNAASRMTEKLFPPNMQEKLKVEYITPLVLALASEENKDAGMIFNCMGGWFSRTAIMCSEGVIIGDGTGDISPEDVMNNWEKICSTENGKTLGSIGESFGYLGKILS